MNAIKMRLACLREYLKSALFAILLPAWQGAEQRRTIEGLRLVRVLRKNMRNARMCHVEHMYPPEWLFNVMLHDHLWNELRNSWFTQFLDLADEAEKHINKGHVVLLDPDDLKLLQFARDKGSPATI